MWLKTRMYLLVAVLFGILYGVIVGVGTWLGIGGVIPYLILGFCFPGHSVSYWTVTGCLDDEGKVGLGKRSTGTTPDGS